MFSKKIHEAVGTSAVFGFLIAFPGAIIFAITGFEKEGLPLYSIGYINVSCTVESCISKKPSLVNKILCWSGSLYTKNHMLNSKNLTIVQKFGDKTEFTIVRFHCTYTQNIAILNTYFDWNII